VQAAPLSPLRFGERRMRALKVVLIAVATFCLAACGESKTVRDLKTAADQAEARADDAEQKAAELQTRLDDLDKRVTALETDDSDEDDPTIDRNGATTKVVPGTPGAPL
jgi:uncharacterized protein YlxW (UPF0749 family)